MPAFDRLRLARVLAFAGCGRSGGSADGKAGESRGNTGLWSSSSPARELKRKYARSVLGVVWSVLNPLLSMAVLSLIFSQLFRRSIENYPIYYLTGYLLWQAFTATTNAAMTTLADNRALLLKVKFPMELFILTRGCHGSGEPGLLPGGLWGDAGGVPGAP